MKKITLSVLLGLFLTFNMYAQFPEGFETAVPPAGWTSFIGTNGEGTGFNWTTTTTAANGSAQAAYVRYEAVTTTAEDWLVTPQFTPTAGMPILTFQQRQGFGADYGTSYSIRISTTSQTDHASFTAIDTYGETAFSTVYGAKNIDLTAYVGTPIYVAFVMENNDGDNWYIDDVDMIADANPPNCAMNPTPAIGATDVVVDGGSITIAWEAATTGDPATSYEVFWGTTSGSLNSLGTLSATTVNITGSEYSTNYYWMIVPSNVGGPATGCVEWSFTTEDAPPPPPNDECSGAETLTIGATTSGTTTNATGASSTSCNGTIGNDVWYTFVGNGETVTITVDSPDEDSQIGVFESADCAGITLGSCAYGVDPFDNPAVLTFPSTNGTNYYIQVGGWLTSAAPSDFDITVTSVPTPPNNDCSGAIALTLGNSITVDNTGGTDSGASASCDSGVISDIWYSFVATSTTEAYITTTAPQVSVWDACGGAELACNPGTGVPITGLTDGTTYYIRVNDDGTTRVPGSFTIAVDEALSTEDVAFEGFKYYPNPVEGTLSLRAQDNIQAVSVYNMLGQEVMRSTPDALEDEVDMSSLQTGAYFLKVRINDLESNFRIIKE